MISFLKSLQSLLLHTHFTWYQQGLTSFETTDIKHFEHDVSGLAYTNKNLVKLGTVTLRTHLCNSFLGRAFSSAASSSSAQLWPSQASFSDYLFLSSDLLFSSLLEERMALRMESLLAKSAAVFPFWQ